jgi:hypothetical protein
MRLWWFMHLATTVSRRRMLWVGCHPGTGASTPSHIVTGR